MRATYRLRPHSPCKKCRVRCGWCTWVCSHVAHGAASSCISDGRTSISARSRFPPQAAALQLLSTELRDEPERCRDLRELRSVGIASDIYDLGGLAPTHALLDRGWSARYLAAAVHRGEIIRVRQGWYSFPDTPAESIRAARVGGRLGCVSGAATHGLLVRADSRLHVSVPPHAARLRTPDDAKRRLSAATADPSIVVHWEDRRTGSRFVAHPLDCMLQMIVCEPVEFVVAAADSALRSGLISHRSWSRAIATQPPRVRSSLARVDPRSESITESLIRFRLGSRGIEARPQVLITGYRADLLVGRRLVIEGEGFMFHGSREQFESDRARFAALSTAGYRVLWFSYRQVVDDWPAVWRSIAAALERGDHL